MEERNYKTKKEPIEIAIVGVGGIGSNLSRVLIPALSQGRLAESLGGIKVTFLDSDTVEKGNISHQSFFPEQQGMTKVMALKETLSPFEGDEISVEAIERDVREPGDLRGYDFVVVAVDSHEARRAVHVSPSKWLDLRCLGDGYTAVDSSVIQEELESLTGEQNPASCQHPDAVSTGNIQFGYLLAAAHGAQWIIQELRSLGGHTHSMPPRPRFASITFGTLGRPATYGSCF